VQKNHEHLEKKIERAINSVSAENASNTPDYILAQYLMACLRLSIWLRSSAKHGTGGRTATFITAQHSDQPGERARIIELLKEGATVLDEPYHHRAIANAMLDAHRF